LVLKKKKFEEKVKKTIFHCLTLLYTLLVHVVEHTPLKVIRWGRFPSGHTKDLKNGTCGVICPALCSALMGGCSGVTRGLSQGGKT